MRSVLRTILGWHRPLAWFAAAMVGLAAVSAVGYLIDDRVLVDVPIWAKPLKFSASFVLYAVTLAWMVSRLRQPRRRRIARGAATVLAGASTLEMVAIVGQVIRGRQSHFNNSTPFDSIVFAAMGGLVGVIFIATAVIALVLVVESPMADRAATWGVRLGLAISLAGLSVGFLMLPPTPEQSSQGGDALLRGAHSVGVADGGPSLPVLGWSTTGGDLRVAHFVGMHALQVLPLLAISLTVLPATARLCAITRRNIVLLGAVTYGGVFALTLWQALRGQALTHPDRLTLAALAGLVLLIALGAANIVRAAHRPVTVAA